MQLQTRQDYIKRSESLKKILFPNGEGDIYFLDVNHKKDSPQIIQHKEIDMSVSSVVQAWSELKKDYINCAGNEENLALKFQLQIRHLYELSAILSREIIHDFVASLKTYMIHADIHKKHHRDAIQAHVDLIFLAFKRDLKIEDRAKVKALWNTLKQFY